MAYEPILKAALLEYKPRSAASCRGLTVIFIHRALRVSGRFSPNLAHNVCTIMLPGLLVNIFSKLTDTKLCCSSVTTPSFLVKHGSQRIYLPDF